MWAGKTRVAHVNFPFSLNHSVEDLQVKLCEVTGVEVKEQELMMVSGQTLEPKTLVMDCIKHDIVRLTSCIL